MPLFTEQLRELRSKLENYEAKIPEQRDHGLFMKKIANLMNHHNLREQVIEPLEEIKTDGLICIPISMECRGKLAQIFEFYQQLQELDRQIRIKQVKLENNTDFNGEIAMEAEVVIYYRKVIG